MGLLIGSLAAATVPPAQSAPPAHFVLTSPDASLSQRFPDAYVFSGLGCSGGNQSPPLRWRGAPPGTRSFVLTLFDRDEHSTPSGWWHWVIYDLPATATELPGGAGAVHSSALPPPALQGRTDLGTAAYHGACPAKGDAPHRYVFTLYALDVEHLDVAAESSGAMVVSSAAEHVVGKATFVVHHGR